MTSVKKYRPSIFGVIFALIIIGCTPQKNSSVSENGGMAEVLAFASKLKSDKAKKTMQEALEDFDLVLAGKLPKYSKLDATTLNGVSTYKGNGYILQLIDTDGTIAGEYIKIYGPVIEFTDSEFQILEKKISEVRFYDRDKYQILKGSK